MKNQNKVDLPAIKDDKNTVVVKYLTAIAVICALISAGVLAIETENARDVVQITFTPVATIVAGLIGYLKS